MAHTTRFSVFRHFSCLSVGSPGGDQKAFHLISACAISCRRPGSMGRTSRLTQICRLIGHDLCRPAELQWHLRRIAHPSWQLGLQSGLAEVICCPFKHSLGHGRTCMSVVHAAFESPFATRARACAAFITGVRGAGTVVREAHADARARGRCSMEAVNLGRARGASAGVVLVGVDHGGYLAPSGSSWSAQVRVSAHVTRAFGSESRPHLPGLARLRPAEGPAGRQTAPPTGRSFGRPPKRKAGGFWTEHRRHGHLSSRGAQPNFRAWRQPARGRAGRLRARELGPWRKMVPGAPMLAQTRDWRGEFRRQICWRGPTLAPFLRPHLS